MMPLWGALRATSQVQAQIKNVELQVANDLPRRD